MLEVRGLTKRFGSAQDQDDNAPGSVERPVDARVLPMVLSVAGIHGVISYTVTQRTREWGIRLALGATRLDIFRKVLAAASRPVLLGRPAAARAATLMKARSAARARLLNYPHVRPRSRSIPGSWADMPAYAG